MLVNDRADVALLVGADGVHLPEAGLTVAQARELLGPDALIGRSCHDRAGFAAADAAGASFATLGPIGPVPGKGPPMGADGFARAVEELPLPAYALGGVDAAAAPALVEAGAAGVAVVRAVYDAPDPAAAVAAILRTLG
jgi:thiamine-phosphate pyrophosphorylase